MKRKIFYFLGILVVGIICTYLMNGVPQEEWDADNFGKVIGRLVDEETGENVKEEFLIKVFKSSVKSVIERHDYALYTDNHGFFSFEWEPGLYYLYCSPKNLYDFPRSGKSEYANDPDPLLYPDTFHNIKIEKGKITKVIKKVYKAGTIKVFFVDPNGSQINLEDIFPNGSVSVNLEHDAQIEGGERSVAYLSQSRDPNTGVHWKKGLFPGQYKLEIEFKRMGIGSRIIRNIFVEKKIITEVKVVVDLNDTTGVKGRVVDQNNLPAKNITVRIFRLRVEGEEQIDASSSIDSNGYFQISGLKEGLYDIYFHYQDPNDLWNFFNTTSQTIYIKKNQMVTFNKKINF